MEVKKQLQEKYIELQNLDRQIRLLQQQFQNLENQILELQIVKQSLDDLRKIKLEKELLVPISPGIFIKTILKDNKNLVVNVGASVAAKKNVTQTKELLNIQMEEVKKLQMNILVDMQKLSDQARSLEKEINELVVKLKK